MNRWEARKARTRRLIVDTAMRVFLDGGYLETTVEQLIDEAGVSRATFYSHFQNKLELLNAVVDEHIEHRAFRFRALAALPEIDVASIASWLDMVIADARTNRDSVRLFRLAVALDTGIMQRFTHARDKFSRILAPRFRGFDINSGSSLEREERRASAHFFVILIEQFFASLADGSWVIDIDVSKDFITRNLLENR